LFGLNISGEKISDRSGESLISEQWPQLRSDRFR